MNKDDPLETYLKSDFFERAHLPRANLTYANLEDSGQRGANLAVAVMLNANLDFTDLYGARLGNTVVKGGGIFFINAG